METDEKSAAVTHTNVIVTEEFVKTVNAHIASEESIVRSVRMAVAVICTLSSVLVWVFTEKNAEFKSMQTMINVHSVQINETLAILRGDMENSRRALDSIEKRLDREERDRRQR